MLKSICAAALAVAFVVAMPMEGHAKQCKKYNVKGDAMKATNVAIPAENTAKFLARQNWVKNCMDRAGNPWCNVKIARTVKMSCNEVPNGLGGYNHTCEYFAKPCRN